MSPLAAQLVAEWRYQRRRPFVWACIAVYFAIAFGDAYQIGVGDGGFLWVNGAGSIAARATMLSLLGVLAAAGIIGEAAARDRTCRTEELVLSSGSDRLALGLGRFAVGWLMCALACAAFVPGMLLGSMMPGIPPEKLGPTELSHYAKALAYFLLPNFFIVGAVVFAAGSRRRSQAAAYLAGVGLLVLWLLSRMLLGQDVLRHDVFPLYALAEPFGFTAAAEFKFGWTVAQNNERFVPFAGLLLWNRVLWLVLAGALLAAAIRWLPMQPTGPLDKRQRRRRLTLPGSRARSELALATRWELLSLARLPGLGLLLFLAAVTLWLAAASAATHQFSLPTTDLLVHGTDFYFDKILIVVLAWSASELVWRERALGVAAVVDALPTRDSMRFAARTLALFVIVLGFWLLAVVVNVLYQLLSGVPRLELWLHFTDSFAFKAPRYLWMAVLALVLQVLVRRRYLAMAVFLVIYVSPVLLDALGLYHPLYRYGEVSFFWYSLMDGYGHFVEPHAWMVAYWTLGAAVLWLLGLACVTRGVDPPLRRAQLGAALRAGRGGALVAVPVVAFVAVGATIWYRSAVQSPWPPPDHDAQLAAVEKQYRERWRGVPQPRVVALRSEIDLYPGERRVAVRGTYTLENPHAQPIDEVLLLMPPSVELTDVAFAAGATRVSRDATLGTEHWRLAQPLGAGARTELAFATASAPVGALRLNARNDGVPAVGEAEVIGNGTSLLNLQLMPALGYTDRVEHKPRWKRRRYGLPLDWQPPAGERALREPHDTLHLGWVEEIDTTVTTAGDQVPLHAGVLVDAGTTADGRRWARYRIPGPARGWSAVMSGRYATARYDDGAVPLEFYFTPEHTYTLERMAEEFQGALAHFASRYGPAPFEAMKVAQQSLHYDGLGNRAGLGFATEILGWKSDLARSEGAVIRRMAAHMMGMSWFGDQVIPANVAGAKVIHAGLPYWSAGLYLLQTQDPLRSRELRRQELAELFRKRSALSDEDLPFVREYKDSTMIRRKGMVMIAYLAELAGAERIEAAFAGFLDAWRHRPPPYPTAADLLTHLRAELPARFHPQLEDVFEHVTRWDLRVEAATAAQLPDGAWRVRATIATRKFYAAGLGEETEAAFATPVVAAVA
ncbi:MAG: hypothetical protein AAGD86_01025, partial [Pseudomonadota bacterium]